MARRMTLIAGSLIFVGVCAGMLFALTAASPHGTDEPNLVERSVEVRIQVSESYLLSGPMLMVVEI